MGMILQKRFQAILKKNKKKVHSHPMDSGHFRNRFRRLLTYISYDPSKAISSNPKKLKKKKGALISNGLWTLSQSIPKALDIYHMILQKRFQAILKKSALKSNGLWTLSQ